MVVGICNSNGTVVLSSSIQLSHLNWFSWLTGLFQKMEATLIPRRHKQSHSVEICFMKRSKTQHESELCRMIALANEGVWPPASTLPILASSSSNSFSQSVCGVVLDITVIWYGHHYTVSMIFIYVGTHVPQLSSHFSR